MEQQGLVTPEHKEPFNGLVQDLENLFQSGPDNRFLRFKSHQSVAAVTFRELMPAIGTPPAVGGSEQPILPIPITRVMSVIPIHFQTPFVCGSLS